MYLPKVSIITPCYNGEKKIGKFLESLLNQTYTNIELIIINDGSTDDTEKVIFSYSEMLKEKCIDFVYLKQANAGQAAALNNGLKYFTGEYLMWPDSDDIFSPCCIEKMIVFLERNTDVGLVHCNAFFVSETGDVIKRWDKNFSEVCYKNFLDVLLWKNLLASGVWMVRSKTFIKVRSNKEIEIFREGQNWQMLLPLSYNYRIGKVNEFLFNVVLWKDSHSRAQRTYKEKKERIIGLGMGRMQILENMVMLKDHYERSVVLVNEDMNRKLFALACDNQQYGDAHQYYGKLVNKKIADKIKLILTKLEVYRLLKQLDFSRYIKNLVRR